MINIIEHGIEFYKMKCPYCKCKFEFQKEDVQEFSSDKSQYVMIFCPDCLTGIKAFNCATLEWKYNN